jgi:SNF2 family DNA or RNA helicase
MDAAAEIATLGAESELSVEELLMKEYGIDMKKGGMASIGTGARDSDEEDVDEEEEAEEEEDEEDEEGEGEEPAEPVVGRRKRQRVDYTALNTDEVPGVSEEKKGESEGEADRMDVEGGASASGKQSGKTSGESLGRGMEDEMEEESGGEEDDDEGMDEGKDEEKGDTEADDALDRLTKADERARSVNVARPFILSHTIQLREYQHVGLNWLVSLHERRLNGILADEMGLGKTIQTISLLAYLACFKGIWGPHLVVVPTSCIVNWETELKKWCPAFKVLTYVAWRYVASPSAPLVTSYPLRPTVAPTVPTHNSNLTIT